VTLAKLNEPHRGPSCIVKVVWVRSWLITRVSSSSSDSVSGQASAVRDVPPRGEIFKQAPYGAEIIRRLSRIRHHNEGLQDFFAQAGEVATAAVVTDRDTGRSRGFGFVEMMTPDGARRAVADLNGRELDGRPLRSELSKPKLDGNANRHDGPWR